MSLVDKIKEEYIEKYLENSKSFKFHEIDFDRYKVKRHLYKDLGNVDLKGYYPFASEYVDKDFKPTTSDKGELCFYFLPVVHELYIGTTGSGKTTGCVEPQLRAVSSLSHKPNLFVTDPKGELFDRNAKHLKSMGYQIFSLNFKDIDYSDRWNPLLEMYDENYKIKDILKSPVKKQMPIDKKYKLFSDEKDYKDHYFVQGDYAFSTLDYAEQYQNIQISFNKAKVQDLVNQFANMVVKVRSQRDPSWDEGALRLLKGLLYAMLEDSVDDKCNFTRDMMNLKTVKELYTEMSKHSNSTSGIFELTNNPPFKHKKQTDYSVQLMRQSMSNAPTTRRNYTGVFDTATQKWFDNKILHLTLDNTINLDDIGDEPFVIFLITRDYEKNDFLVAGIFIDWLYRRMIQEFESGKETREFHFMLEEFGNIPRIEAFENKISSARSRNIWFHLVVQSYAQIQNVYDDVGRSSISNVIIDNCNAQIFLGSQHFATRERFSKECGFHSVEDFNSKTGKTETKFETVLLIPLSKLDEIKPGEIYVKRTFMPVLKSTFVRSYKTKEFAKDNFRGFDIIDKRKQVIDFTNYTYTPPKDDEFDISASIKRWENFDF